METTENSGSNYIKMDYSITSPQERVKKVEEIIAATPPEKLTNKYLEKLSDYIIFALDKQEKKEKKILTENRMVTVNDRETSFEGLAGKLENGEDGIYNMITNDKNIIHKPKVTITEEDLKEVPGLQELRDAIVVVEEQFKNSRGIKAYKLGQQLIQMRKDQYILKNSYRQPHRASNIIRSIAQLDLTEKVTVDSEGKVHSTAIVNFFTPEHISALLCNYSKIKEDSWDRLNSDAKWLMEDFDALVDEALAETPLYLRLVQLKIDGLSNANIQKKLLEEFEMTYTVEYLSSLWRNKIPKMIAAKATNNWLEWHYTVEEKGYWKRCSRCGQIKLGHNNFFSKNKTSKDGWYSICKDCRNRKR